MESTDGQLQVKYQKIVTEYSKIRAQANVLKKAVIDEQARNTDVRERLKEKEVELRRAEQELDSLTFRNQQLTKRVTVLQEELDRVQTKGSRKGRSESADSKTRTSLATPVSPPDQVLDEEFQKKILENAQLLSRLADDEVEIEALNDRIRHLEHKLDIGEKSKMELESKYSDTMEKLEREKAELQRRLNERLKLDETTSWSSGESKRDSYDLEPRIALPNHRRGNISPNSSPTMSRGSIKSRVPSASREESGDEYEVVKLSDLEKELNRWKARCRAAEIKRDELERKCVFSDSYKEDSLPPLKIENAIGKFSMPFATPEEVEVREGKTREYFLSEIDKLITEKHACQAKNLAIAAAIEVLNVHLETSELKREKCEIALSEALSNHERLQEDKEAQEGNYKTQLSTMSEHLANMNEKLVRRTEEIQRLKFDLANKIEKKGKQK
ncbi:trichohyalin [Orussus abietinus]|uniref:trichohyalin n=1 Tax=Orussus abietinus TaxID=222816 RepID=UPI000626C853|nr:trichohyalin [Orussus abietinus]